MTYLQFELFIGIPFTLLGIAAVIYDMVDCIKQEKKQEKEKLNEPKDR